MNVCEGLEYVPFTLFIAILQDLQISHTRSINDIAFNASDERILATVGGIAMVLVHYTCSSFVFT